MWAKHIIKFVSVTERVCYIDAKLHGVKFRIISVYLPDSTYLDAEVQSVYDQLTEIVQKGRREKLKIVIGGDFNARVGEGEEDE